MAAHGAYTSEAWGKHGAVLGAHIDAWTALVGKSPQIWHTYHDFEDNIWYPGNGGPFPVADANEIRNRGAVFMLSWGYAEPFNNDPNSQPNYTYKALTAGNWNAYIDKFAADVQAWGSDILIRPFWEFEHKPFNKAWNIGHNGNTTADFIAGWRYLYNRVRLTTQRMKFVWCPVITGVQEQYWPGAQFVDYIGWDAYTTKIAWGYATEYKPLVEEYRAGYAAAQRLNRNKKILICEHSADETGNKGNWIRRGYRNIAAEMPNITGLVFFSQDYSDPVPEAEKWRVNTSAKSLRAYRDAIKGPQFNGSFT